MGRCFLLSLSKRAQQRSYNKTIQNVTLPPRDDADLVVVVVVMVVVVVPRDDNNTLLTLSSSTTSFLSPFFTGSSRFTLVSCTRRFNPVSFSYPLLTLRETIADLLSTTDTRVATLTAYITPRTIFPRSFLRLYAHAYAR